jgi:hypothetical protein
MRSLHGLQWTAFALFALGLAAYQYYVFTRFNIVLFDYRAFWCGGHALAQGLDPYRTASLLSCEQIAMPFHLASAQHGVVIPAPLPGYALALFVPLALLPYPVASLLWMVVLIGCSAECVILCARVTGANPLLCAWTFVVPAVMLWIPYGELAVVSLFGALVSAYGLSRSRYALCALGACIAAIEPHIALGAWISLILWERHARLPLIVGGSALAALWLSTGLHRAVEYLTQVLPVHALAEVARGNQYSATWIAHLAGLDAHWSVRTGLICYAIMTAGGVALAGRLNSRTGAPGWLVLLPLAACATGGSFVHEVQVTAALPFAVLFFQTAPGRARATAAAIVIALALPWYQVLWMPIVIVLVVICAFTIGTYAIDRRYGLYAAAAAGALCICLLHLEVQHVVIAASHAIPRELASPSPLASVPWGRASWREESAITAALVAEKGITWLALIAAFTGAVYALRDAPLARGATRTNSAYLESA